MARRKGSGWTQRRGASSTVSSKRSAAEPAPAQAAHGSTDAHGGRPRHLVTGAIAGVLAVIVGLGVVLGVRGTTHDTAAPKLPGAAPAPAFRVVYRVDDSLTSPSQVHTETDVLEVERPDHLRLEHHEGPPPGGRLLEGSVVNRQDTMSLPDDFASPSTPLTIPNELQLFSEPILRDAVAAGKAESQGTRRVLGASCTRYLYQHFGSEPLTRGSSEEHVETCVTPDSIMLREAITFGGREVRVVEAVALDRAPQFAPDAFLTIEKKPNPVAADNSQVVQGAPDAVSRVVHGTAPAGFRMDWDVTDVIQESEGMTWPFYIARYTRGADFVVTEQFLVHGTTEVPWTKAGGDVVDLGQGRKGNVLYHPGFVEVQTTVDGDHVRVLASRAGLARDEAAQLHAPS